jgi:hypothetical protein
MGVKEHVSERGSRASADATPFLVYGHGSEALASHISTWTTLSCLSIESLDDLRTVLDSRPCVGVAAMSYAEAVGEAGKAIRLLREVHGDAEAAIYRPWDYNVARAAKRAIEYEADGILMPGIDSGEQLQCLLHYLMRVQRFMKRPSTCPHCSTSLRLAHGERSKRST